MVSLGNRLKAERKRSGLTQEQLAERVGVSRAAVARYEAGEIEPSLKTLVLLADTLRVSTDRLLGREPLVSCAVAGLTPKAAEALELFLRAVKDVPETEENNNEKEG